MIEIRMHGRGGQGTVVAAQILAIAAGKDGKKSQSFSSFGAERRGAPVEAFVRIDSKPILKYSRIYEPDIVVLMDATLQSATNVLDGLKPNGTLIVNSPTFPELPTNANHFKVALVDAGRIAWDIHLGPSHSPIINTAMLGAIATIPELVSIGSLIEAIKDYFPARWQLNVTAAETAFRSTVLLDRHIETPHKLEEPLYAKKRALPLFLEKSAPCREACPIGIDMEGAMRLLEEGKLEKAWTMILEENPFPAVTGRVCFHPCRYACNRKGFDEPVAINAVERFLGDWGLANEKTAERLSEKHQGAVAVIGAGPAGLSACYHLLRLGYSVSVFDNMPEPGGILRYGIPPYRLPKDVLAGEIKRLTTLGAEWHLGTQIDRQTALNRLLAYDAVLLATGAHRSQKLNIPGENLDGVTSALSFLQAINSVDGFAGNTSSIGGKVAVVGGGNTAIDAARSALRLGAEVKVLYRRGRKEMPAHREEVEQAENEGVQFEFFASPKRFHGEGNRVKSVVFQRTAYYTPARRGRKSLIIQDDTDLEISADTVLVAVGESCDLDYLFDGIEIGNGLVVSDSLGRTTFPKIFAGGDLTTQQRTVAWAIQSGKTASIAIDMMLRGVDHVNDLAAVRIGSTGSVSFQAYRGELATTRSLGQVAGFESINPAYFKRTPSKGSIRTPMEERTRDFREVNIGLTAEQALFEAQRCFHCGSCTDCDNCYIYCPDAAIQGNREQKGRTVQPDHCKSCGICIRECPRGVISLPNVKDM